MTRFLALFLVLGVLVSCDSNRLFEENTAISGHAWSRGNVLTYKVPVTDINSFYNIYINIRHSGQYSMQNIFLFTTIQSPDGNQLVDTVEIMLADDRGEWYGSGLGDIFSVSAPYKHLVQFPQKGTYTFTIEQAMRQNDLKNIEDVGLRVEFASPK